MRKNIMLLYFKARNFRGHKLSQMTKISEFNETSVFNDSGSEYDGWFSYMPFLF